MRQQKIRGFNRRFIHIDKWRFENLDLRLDLIEEYNYYHIGIGVHPWCNISLINSIIPEPKGKAKELLLNGLIDIYESWKVQLDKLGNMYYLKIWLFEPRFSKSQVVCAVSNRIEYYQNGFYKPDFTKHFKPNNYGKLSARLQKFDWDCRYDEDHYENNFVGEPNSYASRQDYEYTTGWFNKLLKKPHRISEFEEPIEEATEFYSFKRGDVWIGEKKVKMPLSKKSR